MLSERGHEDLFNSARMVLYSLNSVRDKDLNHRAIDQMIRDNPRDAAALLACKDVLFNLSISPHPGHARSFFSYSINMATLFQNYCHRLTAFALQEAGFNPHKSLIFPIEGLGEQAIRLDGLFDSGSCHVLMECKYKSIRSIDDVSRSDIYQTISYCSHAEVQPNLAIMLFPATTSQSPANILGSIGGFKIKSKNVYAITISLKHTPVEVFSRLRDLLNTLLTE